MHWVDYLILSAFLMLLMLVGYSCRKRAATDVTSFFISSRSLVWYLAGGSMIATSFASDTPLWITSLIREHGIHAIWQFWAPVIGASLGVVLFSRLWRRLGVITDMELIELRYSGMPAAWLRGVSSGVFALVLIPLIMAWVIKAMETISQQAMGIPDEYRIVTTFITIGAAVLISAFSGLFGVVYTDFIQLLVAVFGTIVLAVIAVNEVGGINELLNLVSTNSNWPGHDLAILPSVGNEPGSMTIWNTFGYFGLMWWIVAQSGGFQAQRILASKDIREASRAQLMFTIVYYAVLAWPWIIVALCSIVLLPELSGGSQDAVYPKMLVLLLPTGLRGLVVASLVAAFISTISTLFNWASSYFVYDLYKRFIYTEASDKHYIFVARIATIGIAITGGLISLYADSIQQLLEAYYTIALSINLLAIIRWFWWRQNAIGELAGMIVAWITALLMLNFKLFDSPARLLLRLDEDANLSADYGLLGARILWVAAVSLTTAICVSKLTRATDMSSMKDFVMRARPFHYGWKPVIARLDDEYFSAESLKEVLLQWLVITLCAISLIFAIGLSLIGNITFGIAFFVLFVVLLKKSISDINRQPDANTQSNNNQ